MINQYLLKIKMILSVFILCLNITACHNDSADIGPVCESVNPSLFMFSGSQHTLVNTLEKEIWFNTTQDTAAFSKIKLSPKWLAWRKEGVKAISYQKLSMLRSPGCKQPGEFSQQTAFGLPFVHGLNILQSTLELPGTPFRRTQIEAYFEVSFSPKIQLVILQDPDNNRFLKLWQSQDVERDLSIDLKSRLPQGWSLRKLGLEETLVAQFTGSVQQLETPDSSVFMGPLPVGFNPEKHGNWQE